MPRKKKEDTSNMPVNVASQAAKAEELQKKLAAGEDLGIEKDPGDGSKKPDDKPAVQPVVKDPGVRVEPGADPGQSVQPADDIAALQHKLGTLEGKYSAEMQRMSTIVEAQQKTIEEQAATIKSLQENPVPPIGEGTTVTPLLELETEDFKGYGDEMVDLVNLVNSLTKQNAMLKDQLSSRPTGDNKELNELRTQVGGLVEETARSKRDAYYRALDAQVPDWEQINISSEFSKWVDQVEPIIGVPRRAILQRANQNLDAARVIAIFRAFKSVGAQPAVIPEERDPLEGEAIPDDAGANKDPGANQSPAITVEDLKKAERDHIQGRITEKEFNKIYDQFQRQLKATPR